MPMVNAHVHMVELAGMARRYSGLSMSSNIPVMAGLDKVMPMLRPETLFAQMDEAGVDQSILYAVEAPVVYASNEYVHGLCEAFPDRLLGFASVNPRDPEAPAVLERAIRDLGLRGLKLHPPLQDFFPNDESVFPIYEKCLELDIPVVFHIGSTPFGALCRLAQANPILIDDVAVRFPELRILLTHLGTLWHNETFMVVEKNPNVYVDTAAYVCEIEQMLTPDMVARIGPKKIIFGTDYPTPYAGRMHRMAEFVECIRGLPLDAEVIDGILGTNVRALLGGAADSGPDLTAEAMLAKNGRPAGNGAKA